MYAVILEVQLKTELAQDYFDLATELLPGLEEIDGFVSLERFSPLQRGKLLSISFWRDEEALKRWREDHKHQLVQQRVVGEFSRFTISELLKSFRTTG